MREQAPIAIYNICPVAVFRDFKFDFWPLENRLNFHVIKVISVRKSIENELRIKGEYNYRKIFNSSFIKKNGNLRNFGIYSIFKTIQLDP